MPVVNVNGVQLNYIQMNCDQGDDCQDFVMIHGLATNLAFWCLHHAQFFAKRYRVTIYDLRGHGRSGMTDSGYTPENMAEDLRLLLDNLGIKKAHFLAHSFGGLVALKLACQDPERFSSIILADTHISAVRRLHNSIDWKFGKRIQPVLLENGLNINSDEPYFGYRLLTEMARLQTKDIALSPEFKELVSPLMGKYGKRTASQWLKLMDTTQAEKEMMGDDDLSFKSLSELKVPILAMYGEHSQAMSTGEHLLDVWPHADFRRIRGAGHFFPVSRPLELMGNCMQFLRDTCVDKFPRRGDESKKRYFRSDRIYKQNDAWFFSTREKQEVGPFTDIEDAKCCLQSYVTEMALAEVA